MEAHSELVNNGSLLHLSESPAFPTQMDTSCKLIHRKPNTCKQSLNCSFAVGQNAKRRKTSKPMESALKTGSQYT